MYQILFEIGDKPSLMEIHAFPRSGGQDAVDIMTDSTEDSKFVTCILDDEKGNKIKEIRNNIKQTGGGVMDRVFNDWLNGKGKMPVTWQTLIACLEFAQLMALVEVIKEEMEAGSYLDSLTARYDYSYHRVALEFKILNKYRSQEQSFYPVLPKL